MGQQNHRRLHRRQLVVRQPAAHRKRRPPLMVVVCRYLDQLGCGGYHQDGWACTYDVDPAPPTFNYGPQQLQLMRGGEVALWGEGASVQSSACESICMRTNFVHHISLPLVCLHADGGGVQASTKTTLRHSCGAAPLPQPSDCGRRKPSPPLTQPQPHALLSIFAAWHCLACAQVPSAPTFVPQTRKRQRRQRRWRRLSSWVTDGQSR